MDYVLRGVVGSHAYGLNHPDSDIDVLGVYAARPTEFWGLREPKGTYHDTDPDYTYHELGKYISLALRCNPTVLELMWLADIEADCWGQRLIEIRRSFLSEPLVRSAFGGYAVQQARRLERRHVEGKKGFSSTLQNRTSKHARHCFRLLRQGAELLQTGDMTLKVPDPQALFELGDQPVEEIVRIFEEEFAQFNRIESILPAEPNRGLVERTLKRARQFYYHYEMQEALTNAA